LGEWNELVLPLSETEVVVPLEFKEESCGSGSGHMDKLSHFACITRRDEDSIVSWSGAI
jgi:hypothetical protein